MKTHKLIALKFFGWEWCQCLMWTNTGLISVVSPQWTSSLLRPSRKEPDHWHQSAQLLPFTLKFSILSIKVTTHTKSSEPKMTCYFS